MLKTLKVSKLSNFSILIICGLIFQVDKILSLGRGYLNLDYFTTLLIAVKKVVDNGTLDMEVIVNHKTLDNGQSVIQLETAVGAAMKCFDGCLGKITLSFVFVLRNFI